MAEIIDVTDLIAKLITSDLNEWRVKLSPQEVAILRQAMEICDKAGELQSIVLKKKYGDDDSRDNLFEWARIYLDNILLEERENEYTKEL